MRIARKKAVSQYLFEPSSQVSPLIWASSIAVTLNTTNMRPYEKCQHKDADYKEIVQLFEIALGSS